MCGHRVASVYHGRSSQHPGHALRMFRMSEVKSMTCLNALCIVNYMIQGIREILMSLQHLSLINKRKINAEYINLI